MITLNFGEDYQHFYLDKETNKIIQFLGTGDFCPRSRETKILEHFNLEDNWLNCQRFKELDLNYKSHLAIFNKLASK